MAESPEIRGLKNVVGGEITKPAACPGCGRPWDEHDEEWHDSARYLFCPGAARTAQAGDLGENP